MKIKIQFFKVHETAISLDECATGNMASFLNCALSFLKYKFFFCVLTNKFGKFWHHFYKFTSLFFFIDVWFVKFKFDLNKYTSRINSFCVNLMSKRWIYIFFLVSTWMNEKYFVRNHNCVDLFSLRLIRLSCFFKREDFDERIYSFSPLLYLEIQYLHVLGNNHNIHSVKWHIQ